MRSMRDLHDIPLGLLDSPVYFCLHLDKLFLDTHQSLVDKVNKWIVVQSNQK